MAQSVLWHHSVLQGQTGRGEGKTRSHRTRAGGLMAATAGRWCEHSPQPVRSQSRNPGAKITCKNTSSKLPECLRVHSTEKGKTIWFFSENPSHPPVFNNNNNLCYEQLPYKSNYLRRFMCYVWKELLASECILRGQQLRTKPTSQKQEV